MATVAADELVKVFASPQASISAKKTCAWVFARAAANPVLQCPHPTHLGTDHASRVLGTAVAMHSLLDASTQMAHHTLSQALAHTTLPNHLRRRVRQLSTSANCRRHCSAASLGKLLKDVEQHLSPSCIVQQALQCVHATWVSPFLVRLQDGCLLDLHEIETAAWAHLVREQLRLAMWAQAAARRNDMMGIEAGLERDATQALLLSGKFGAQEVASLRKILAGGVWTQDRACRAKLQATSVCPYCDSGEVEDHEHLWWHCKAWNSIRCRHSWATDAFEDSWPACLRLCLLMPCNLEAKDVAGLGEHRGTPQSALAARQFGQYPWR